MKPRWDVNTAASRWPHSQTEPRPGSREDSFSFYLNARSHVRFVAAPPPPTVENNGKARAPKRPHPSSTRPKEPNTHILSVL
jgi:hypothetical protein